MNAGTSHSLATLFAMVLLLSSCQSLSSSAPGITDRMVLPQLNPCQPVACWQGVSLDAMRPESVEALTRQIPGFENAELTRTWSRDNYNEYGWSGPTRSIFVTFRDDRGFIVSQLTYKVELKHIIQRFGNPSHVGVSNNYALGRYTANANVVFASQGLILLAAEEQVRDNTLNVSPDMRIIGYILTKSDNLRGIVEAMRLAARNPPKDTQYVDKYVAKAQPWHGYGEYRVDSPD